MMTHLRFLSIALIVAFLGLSLQAAEADEKITEEDALRTEATEKMTGLGRDSVRGQFVAIALTDDAAAKPFPKVVGALQDAGVIYQIMVLTQNMLEGLQASSKKEITLMGKHLDKGEKGKFFIADEVVVPDSKPIVRRKRGGL